jgi:transposase
MTNQTQVSEPANSFRPRDYDVFAGLDVDHHSIAATFTDHDRLMRSLRLSYSAAQLLNYVHKHFPGQRLAFVYEAGPTGFGLYDELMAAGHPCLVVAPPMVPRAPGARVKTNRLDSRKLSTALRGGELKSIHVPSVRYRELRHLVQLRDTHVQQLKATKCRIKALLLYEGIAFPSDAGKVKQWSARVLDELLELPCSQAVRFKLDRDAQSHRPARNQRRARPDARSRRGRHLSCRHGSPAGWQDSYRRRFYLSFGSDAQQDCPAKCGRHARHGI